LIMKVYYDFLQLSQQYLLTSKLILQQLRDSNNISVIVSDHKIETYELIEATKWSDFNTLTPALFLLRQGMELLVKGLAIWIDEDPADTHQTGKMIDYLRNDKRFSNDYIELISSYVGSGPKQRLIQEFGDTNRLENYDSKLNEALRYPITKKGEGKRINFTSLRYRHDEILEDIDNIICDIEKVLKEAVRLVNGTS
jgi:hypothetical protein